MIPNVRRKTLTDFLLLLSLNQQKRFCFRVNAFHTQIKIKSYTFTSLDT